jgi:D-sedoheptulose 7-phosphate isomerase
MTRIEHIRNHLLESAIVQQQLAGFACPVIAAAATRVVELVARGGKIMICGNGGSAGDSQHLAAEFTSRLRVSMERPPIPALALTTDTSYLTARANDYGFDQIFERLIDALGRPGDILIGISTSGNSANVIRATKRCKERNIFTIGFLGCNGGQLATLVDVPIIVPSDSTQHIQEAHISIGHILCEVIEDALYGPCGILCSTVRQKEGETIELLEN